MRTEPWNVNIAYDGLLDRLVPDGVALVLDVGCGDGLLSARLARRVPSVVGLDADAAVLRRARSRFPQARVEWVVGDVMTHPLAPATYDAVVSNACLHHLPGAAAALTRLGGLVAPGGRLAVVTFVRTWAIDLPWQALAWVARAAAVRLRGNWEHSAPHCLPPPDTLASLTRAAHERLPGSRTRRLLYGRVLLTWDRPANTPGPAVEPSRGPDGSATIEP